MQNIKESNAPATGENTDEEEQCFLLDLFLQQYTPRKTGTPPGRKTGRVPENIRKKSKPERDQ
ncbi:TPA: hypothetical protein JAN03_23670 [Citrobacter freundii]|nr:hypothetical protein [Citrobacter freundii]